MALEFLAYGADVAILAAYWVLAHRGFALPFHLANGIASFALVAFEVQQDAWPLVILTSAFILIAWKGIWREHPQTP